MLGNMPGVFGDIALTAAGSFVLERCYNWGVSCGAATSLLLWPACGDALQPGMFAFYVLESSIPWCPT